MSGAIKRYFRLVIPVAFTVLLAYLFMKFSFFFNKQAGEISYSTWWLSRYWEFDTNLIDVLNTAFIRVLFFGDVRFNHILWTMRYEFFGSMIVFTTLFIFRQRRYRYAAYIILSLWFLRSYYLPFILGLVLSDLYSLKRYTVKLNKDLKRICLLLLGFVGLYLSSCPSGAPIRNTIYAPLFILDRYPYTFYHILGALMLMITLLNWTALQNLFSNRLFIFLGRISFSMYLLHLIVIGSLSSLLLIILTHYFTYPVAAMLVFVISMPVLVFTSYLMYVLVDSKGTILSKIICRWLTGSIRRQQFANQFVLGGKKS